MVLVIHGSFKPFIYKGIFGDYSCNPTTTDCKEWFAIIPVPWVIYFLWNQHGNGGWKMSWVPPKKAPCSTETGPCRGMCNDKSLKRVMYKYLHIFLHIKLILPKFISLVLFHVLLHCRKSTLQSNNGKKKRMCRQPQSIHSMHDPNHKKYIYIYKPLRYGCVDPNYGWLSGIHQNHPTAFPLTRPSANIAAPS